MSARICFFLLFTASAMAHHSESDKPWQVIIQECAMENSRDPTIPPEDPAYMENCILACTMKRIGTMSKNGAYLPEKIIAVLPKDYKNYDQVVAAIKTCSKRSGEDECDTVGVLRSCFFKSLPCADEHECNLASYMFLFYDPKMVQEGQSSD